MSKCSLCGMDHAKEHARGAEYSRRDRVERLGEPFRTISREEGALHDGVELRALQREDGSWAATVYSAEYSEIPMLEVGGYEFVGIAATEARARALAEEAAATAVAKWAGWREKWDRERAERRAAAR